MLMQSMNQRANAYYSLIQPIGEVLHASDLGTETKSSQNMNKIEQCFFGPVEGPLNDIRHLIPCDAFTQKA